MNGIFFLSYQSSDELFGKEGRACNRSLMVLEREKIIQKGVEKTENI